MLETIRLTEWQLQGPDIWYHPSQLQLEVGYPRDIACQGQKAKEWA